MNLVIENVLQLSRRRQAEPQLLDSNTGCIASSASSARSAAVHLETIGSSLQTRMDPNQLTQVLTNLVQNGLRYSGKEHDRGQAPPVSRRSQRSAGR